MAYTRGHPSRVIGFGAMAVRMLKNVADPGGPTYGGAVLDPGVDGPDSAAPSNRAKLMSQMLGSTPWIRRLVDETARVEPLDRTMVIAAQGLLALLPLLVVMAAFLPQQLTALGLDRFGSMTGIGPVASQMLADDVDALGRSARSTVVDIEVVRSQVGVIGLVVTVLSASSFALAIQRMYERVWEQPHLRGLRARRRCLGWLLGWLAVMQLLTALGWVQDRAGMTVLDPLWFAAKTVVAALIWWWSQQVLLAGRVSWRHLAVPGGVTGVSVVAYASASTVVMPRYAQASADVFGLFGLALSLATWLVGFAAVMVGAAVAGRLVVSAVGTDRLTWLGNERRDLRSS